MLSIFVSVMSALSAHLFHQMNLGNHHAAIHRLTHIVDRQKSHADSRHSFHLHTGFSHTGCPAGYRDLTGFLIEYKFNLTVCQCNNMAQRNQLRVLFRPHDSGDSRDTENIPLGENIDAYFKREVLPYVPHAWMDRKKDKIGYEIPFMRYFYEYTPLRPSSEILTEIKELEASIANQLQKAGL